MTPDILIARGHVKMSHLMAASLYNVKQLTILMGNAINFKAVIFMLAKVKLVMTLDAQGHERMSYLMAA